MKLFLIRHAEAIDNETDSVKDDEYRFITIKGRSVSRKVGLHLKKEFHNVEKIFTSPLIRAVQTAEVMAAALDFEYDIELIDELKNETTIASVQKFFKINSSLTNIALVGHEPKMGILVKTVSDKKDFSDFAKSGVCFIDYDIMRESGKFVWYFNPKKMEFEN